MTVQEAAELLTKSLNHSVFRFSHTVNGRHWFKGNAYAVRDEIYGVSLSTGNVETTYR